MQQSHDNTPEERLRRLIDHVTRFEDSVDYGVYHERGWLLGSGEVESASLRSPGTTEDRGCLLESR